jgi:hypothetical protein
MRSAGADLIRGNTAKGFKMTKDTQNRNPPGKQIEVHMQEGVAIGEKKLFRHRSPGRDNYDVQHIEGDSLEKRTGKWNWLSWVIDRVNNRYQKRIIDGETGAILRDDDKPLSEHRDHGSARRK